MEVRGRKGKERRQCRSSFGCLVLNLNPTGTKDIFEYLDPEDEDVISKEIYFATIWLKGVDENIVLGRKAQGFSAMPA